MPSLYKKRKEKHFWHSKKDCRKVENYEKNEFSDHFFVKLNKIEEII